MSKVTSTILLAVILVSLGCYLGAVMPATLTFAVSSSGSQLERRTSEPKLAHRHFIIPMGDPIDDPKPNSK